MDLGSELEKQGSWGIISMVLAFLGATGFFSWVLFGLWGYASRDFLVYFLFILLLASSIITFVSRRQKAIMKGEVDKVNSKIAKEVGEWVEICEGLKNYLTPAIDQRCVGGPRSKLAGYVPAAAKK